MLLTDTVKVDHEKGICLTDCFKSSKDVLFFLDSQSDEEDKEKSKPKKAPAKTNGHVSPTKHKVVGGKVLRNKTRNAEDEEARNTLAAHQAELHAQRQRDGLAKYTEEGAGGAGKEGKVWKRFLSYKGEAGLPKEAEKSRVGILCLAEGLLCLMIFCRFTSIESLPPSSYPLMGLRCRSISIRLRTRARTTRAT